MSDAKISKSILGPGGEVFIIRRRLGGGSFGEVHEALGEISGMVVAVKSLPLGVDPDGLEARAALNEARPEMISIHHPNVVETLYVCDGTTSPIGPYIMSEYVNGGNLENYLHGFVNRGEKVPLLAALQLMSEIALGSEAIGRKLTHRDIKPDNILLQTTPDGLMPKIGDFGIAKIAEAATRQSSETFKGTAPLAYRAPETFDKGAPNTRKIDTYSVGIVFYEILSLTHPLAKFIPPNPDFPDWIYAHKTEIPDDPRLLRPDTPPAVAMLILRMMAKLPAQRPEWHEVLRILAPSNEPQKPRRVDSKIAALFEQSADQLDKASVELSRRQATELHRTEQERSELDNAAVIAAQKLEELDEYISELNAVRPDHSIKVSKPTDLERTWQFPNHREIRCAFWVPSRPISTKRGRLIGGGYVGVEGSLSLNLALMATPDGTSHYWMDIKLRTHPLAPYDDRMEVMREVGLSRETIEFMQGGGFRNERRPDMPFYFGIPSANTFFSQAPRIGEQNLLDLSEVGTDIEKDFTLIIECVIQMPNTTL